MTKPCISWERLLIFASRLVRLFGAIILFITVLLASEFSIEPSFLFYSWSRWAAIGVTLVFSLGLFICSSHKEINMRLILFFGGLTVILIMSEIVLWWHPLLLPNSLLQFCPVTLIKRAAEQDSRRAPNDPHKRFSIGELASHVVMEGYLRHYAPNLAGTFRTEDENDRWVPIQMDEIGFRNPPGLYSSSNRLDIVLLGDSFTRGTSRVTSAEFLGRLSGLRVYNLGDLGGAPQQWLMALKKYGLPKRPDIVMINFYEGNDPIDAVRLQSLIDSGRPLDEYYRSDETYDDQRRSVRLLRRSAVFSMLYGALRTLNTRQEQPLAVVLIASQKVQIPLCCPSLGPSSSDKVEGKVARGLEIIEDTLKKIRELSSSRIVLSYVPTVTTVYADQALQLKGIREHSLWVDSHIRQQHLAGILSKMAQRNGLFFIDVTPSLRKSALHERLYGDGGHFNQRGYQRYAELVYERLLTLELILKQRI